MNVKESSEILGFPSGKGPSFSQSQSLDKAQRLTGIALDRRNMQERCIAAGLSEEFCNRTLRGTGMTVFLLNGGSLEAAQDMANHADPRTTKIYDRRKDLATLNEIERRIAFEKARPGSS